MSAWMRSVQDDGGESSHTAFAEDDTGRNSESRFAERDSAESPPTGFATDDSRVAVLGRGDGPEASSLFPVRATVISRLPSNSRLVGEAVPHLSHQEPVLSS